LENVGLSDAESVRTFFLGKAVLDIGGGFGGAPRIFLGIARHVTVADPIFAEPNWNELFLSDLGKIGMKMDLLKGKIREALESERSGLEARLIESSRIRAEMLFWVDFNPIAPRGGLSINPSYGEHLVNVPDSSQDVVFLNHVLFKDTAYPERILVEAFRVLASGGKIFVNNTHSDEKVRFFRGFEKDWNVVFHRSDSVISVEMTRK
jgi:SAM-dependent methyltransferase